MNMFIFVCLSLLALIAKEAEGLNPAQKALIQAKLLSSGVGCLKDHQLSISDIKTFRKKMMPSGENAKCFAECLFKKIGIMDDMGKISAASARKNAMQVFNNSEEHLMRVDRFIQMCSNVNDQDISEAGLKGCDRAKLAFTCLVDNAPKFGFDGVYRNYLPHSTYLYPPQIGIKYT